MINHPKWGPLLEDVIEQLLKKDLINLRIIALSALIENQEALLKWFLIYPRTKPLLYRKIAERGL